MKYLWMTLVMGCLSACSTTSPTEPGTNSSSDSVQRLSAEQLGRLPLPAGTKLRTGESLILGVGDGWLGRAVFEVPSDGTASYNFFAEQMPRQGWSLVSSVRGKRSLLVFTRADRSATLEFEDAGVFSSTSVVAMSISPLGGTVGATTGAGAQPLGGGGAGSVGGGISGGGARRP